MKKNLINALKAYYTALGGTNTTNNNAVDIVYKIAEQVVENNSVKIVPWATGTDEEIAAMIQALDSGKLTIADTGWQIGDERTVSLAAMEATGVGETHAAQQVTLVLMDSQHYDLVGGGKDHFVVGLKNCLNETGYMNSTDTSVGSWEASDRRAWCNNVFKNAIPETLRNCFKQFNVITCTEWNGTTNTTSNDYFALFAEKEVFGERRLSNETEAAALTQIEYYATEANRIKTVNGEAGGWWERSPGPSPEGVGLGFCFVGGGGVALGDSAGVARGLAPFGCI